jgi:hypothetical protein
MLDCSNAILQNAVTKTACNFLGCNKILVKNCWRSTYHLHPFHNSCHDFSSNYNSSRDFSLIIKQQELWNVRSIWNVLVNWLAGVTQPNLLHLFWCEANIVHIKWMWL